MNGYRKDSMDRFGDDLTEEVIQYLTLKDKIRLECVSKQWQRCVFEKQFVLEICKRYQRHNSLKRLFRRIVYRRESDEEWDSEEYTSNELDVKRLESVLKKCPNITKVNTREVLESEVLSLIGRYCPRIKSMKCYSSIDSDDNVLSYFRMYGHKLEELQIIGFEDIIGDIVKMCPNLKKIYLYDFTVLLTEEFLPNLEHIVSNICIVPKDLKPFKLLCDKYCKTMKTLDILFCDLTEEELKTCIECIARFENLQSLTLFIDRLQTIVPIEEFLSLIGQNCNKILKLDLRIGEFIPKFDLCFAALTEFKAIKKLKVQLSSETVFSGSIGCFKHCQQINELIIEYFELTEDFFTNIATFVPKLQKLRITTKKGLSDSFINSFRSMKSLQKVVYSYYDKETHSTYKKYWYFGKSLIEVMLSPNGMNVKHINNNCGLIIHRMSHLQTFLSR